VKIYEPYATTGKHTGHVCACMTRAHRRCARYTHTCGHTRRNGKAADLRPRQIVAMLQCHLQSAPCSHGATHNRTHNQTRLFRMTRQILVGLHVQHHRHTAQWAVRIAHTLHAQAYPKRHNRLIGSGSKARRTPVPKSDYDFGQPHGYRSCMSSTRLCTHARVQTAAPTVLRVGKVEEVIQIARFCVHATTDQHVFDIVSDSAESHLNT
jgi:hypothetical protein